MGLSLWVWCAVGVAIMLAGLVALLLSRAAARRQIVLLRSELEVHRERAAHVEPEGVLSGNGESAVLERIAGALATPAAVVDAEDGTILSANSLFETCFLGTTGSPPTSVREILPEGDDRALARLSKADPKEGPGHMLLIRNDGTAVAASAHRVPGTGRPDEGDVLLVLVEDRARDGDAEAELLSAALEASDDGILLADVRGVLTHANQAACMLYGQSLSELRGTPLLGHLVELGEAVRAEDILGVVHRDRFWVGEVLRVCEDGSCRPTRIHMSLIESPGRPPAIVAAVRDLTAEQQMQDEVLRAQKLATLGELTAGITHEIANPLTSVLENTRFVAEMVAKGRTNGDVLEAMEDTLAAADRMKLILEEVRRFTHMGRNGRAETNFGAVVSTALMLAGPAVKGVAKVLLPEGTGPAIRADQGHLTQVVLNLIKNAADAIRETGKQGTIRLEYGETEREACLRVIDDGPGIPEAVQQRLFREYVTTKERGRGTGFGLRLSAKLVADDGGRIELRSKPGAGTVFTITLPRSDVSLTDPKPQPHTSIPLRVGETEITLMQEIDPELVRNVQAGLGIEPEPSAGPKPKVAACWAPAVTEAVDMRQQLEDERARRLLEEPRLPQDEAVSTESSRPAREASPERWDPAESRTGPGVMPPPNPKAKPTVSRPPHEDTWNRGLGRVKDADIANLLSTFAQEMEVLDNSIRTPPPGRGSVPPSPF